MTETYCFIDNTLPQSAQHYLEARKRGLIDLYGKDCFANFVDGFIFPTHRCGPLPTAEAGSQNGLVGEWQKYCDTPPRIADDPGLIDDEYAILAGFSNSLQRQLRQWAGFLQFQLSKEIAEQYRSRVRNWTERLLEVAESIEGGSKETRNIRRAQYAAIVGMKSKLEELADWGAIDRRYYGFVRDSLDCDAALFALAYGYDWYRRGYAYRKLGQDTWCGFHPLRAGAFGEVEAHDIEMSPLRQTIRWSSILTAYIENGWLGASPSQLTDMLEMIRTGFQSAEFQEIYDKEVGERANRGAVTTYVFSLSPRRVLIDGYWLV